MEKYFRQFIEHQVLNIKKGSSVYGEQINARKICNRLQKMVQKSLTQSTNPITLSKIGITLENKNNKQQSIQSLQKNQVFTQALAQVSGFLFKLAYGHSCIVSYPKYNIENVIGFYEISKWLHFSDLIFNSKDLRQFYNQEVIGLLFTQKIMIYKDIYYRVEESQVFKEFIHEFFELVNLRIKQMLARFGIDGENVKDTCMSHIKFFIERYQINQSIRNPMCLSYNNYSNSLTSSNRIFSSHGSNQAFSELQSEQSMNSISIDQLIICFVYISYRMTNKFQHVRMCKLIEEYYQKILKWQKWKMNSKIMNFYNSHYLKLYLANKLNKIQKSKIQIDQEKASQFLAMLVDNGETILDNFVSSLEA